MAVKEKTQITALKADVLIIIMEEIVSLQTETRNILIKFGEITLWYFAYIPTDSTKPQAFRLKYCFCLHEIKRGVIHTSGNI